MAPRISASKPKPALQAALERHLQGEEASSPRVTIRIVKCSTVLSDRDNLYAGYKLLIDQLRASEIISDDDPETVNLAVTQLKVATRKETGTYIEIDIRE